MAQDDAISDGTVVQVGGIDPAGKTQIMSVDSAGQVKTLPASPVADDVVAGRQTFAVTTSATTLITVPAGRTWSGVIAASVSCRNTAAATAAAQAKAEFTTVGTGVIPAAGVYFVVDAQAGAHAVGGTVGSQGSNFGSIPFTVIAPAGNVVTIAVASTNTGTASLVEAFAAGSLA